MMMSKMQHCVDPLGSARLSGVPGVPNKVVAAGQSAGPVWTADSPMVSSAFMWISAERFAGGPGYLCIPQIDL